MKSKLHWILGKSIFFIVALTLILAGCSSTTSSSGKVSASKLGYKLDPNTPAWKLDKSISKKPVTLTWYVNADWWTTDYGHDFITKQIEKDLNVKIKFITGDDTKLNALFSSGQIPDVISIFDGTSDVAKKANTWALPLQDLSNEYDPYFNKIAPQETMNWNKLSDGKTYGYANYSNTAADYKSGMIPSTTAFIIRQDVYDAIGKPEMKTQPEFISAMQKIKAKFPNLIPFGPGEAPTVLQDYIGVPLETNDGKFYDRNLDPDYLSWVKTFNTVYKNGDMSDDSFADNSTAESEKVKSGKYASMLVTNLPQRASDLQTFMQSNPGKQYIAIDGPQSTVGHQPTLSQSGISGWELTYITKKCSDPQRAMELFTYLLSPQGEILTTYGTKGKTYTIDANGKYHFTPAVDAMRTKNPDEFNKVYRFGNFFFFGHDKYNALSDDTTLPAVKQPEAWGKGKLVPHFILENIDPDQGTPEARALSEIETNWSTTLVKLVRAKNDQQYNNVLASYKTFLKQNDWSNIVKIRDQKMAINAKKLAAN